MNVSQLLLEILQKEDVKHIFGVAGDALNPFVTAIDEQEIIEWVGMKHEGNASFAAFAQGELGGNFGVCASTVGPGALHLINGLYNAKKERSPVIAITGQVPVSKIGTNYHQEADLTDIFEDVCAYQAIIRTPENAEKLIKRAIRIALAQNAVCRIELPADIAEMKVPAIAKNKVFRSLSAIYPADRTLHAAADMLNKAKKVGILAGEGCRDAVLTVLDFADKINAPITHSLRAADVFDHSLPNVVGLTGLIGNPSGYKAVMHCDVLLMLGTDFPYSDFLPDKTKTIQIDIRPENIGARTNVDLGIHGHILPTLELLSELVEEKEDDEFLKSCMTEFADWKDKMSGYADDNAKRTPLQPQVFARAISDYASDSAVFVIETGTSAIWASNFMSFHGNRRIIGAFNHGSMAVGLPAAIGAQKLLPKTEVWSLVGDGAFHMSMQDFTTAVKQGLPLKIIVFNNHQLGFVKIEMEEAGLKPNLNALDVPDFNFANFAKLCGGDGVRVEKPEDIDKAVQLAKLSDKPFIIDAVVSSGALSLPPHIGFEEAKGFGLSKVKEIWAAITGDKKQLDNLKEEAMAFIDK